MYGELAVQLNGNLLQKGYLLRLLTAILEFLARFGLGIELIVDGAVIGYCDYQKRFPQVSQP